MEACEEGEEHYSEQHVLLSGLGIWYDKLHIPELGNQRTKHGFDASWLMYMCPQSIFKLMPEFDDAVFAILSAVPNSHIVFIEGRRQYAERCASVCNLVGHGHLRSNQDSRSVWVLYLSNACILYPESQAVMSIFD